MKVIIYRYYAVRRFPSPDNLPSGYVAFRVWGSRPFVASIGRAAYGTVDFHGQIPAALANRHGLLPYNSTHQPVFMEDHTDGNLRTVA